MGWAFVPVLSSLFSCIRLRLLSNVVVIVVVTARGQGCLFVTLEGDTPGRDFHSFFSEVPHIAVGSG